MKALKMLVASLVALVVLIGANAADAKMPGGQMKVKVTDKNANGTVDVAFNGLVVVSLNSNPAKGKWKIVSHNERVMKPVIKEGTFLKATQTQEFGFKALNEGTDQIKLEYDDPTGKATKTFTVTVRVGPKDQNAAPIKPENK